MGQPTPEVPTDLSHISDSTQQGDRVDRSILHPPPLFRSIGLTGLSASLPPHRRLRSVLHRARAVLPANAANETANSWLQAPSSSSNTNRSGASERGPPLKGHVRSHADSEAYSDSLPDITSHQLGLPQPPLEMRLEARETKILSFTSSQAQADKRKHVPLRSNISLSRKMLIPARTVHKPSSTGLKSPPEAHHRRSFGPPFKQSDVPSIETAETTERLVGKRRERWRRRKINNLGAYSQSQPPEEDQEDTFCQWLSSLGISDRERDRGEGLNGSNRQDHGLNGAQKGPCPSRRDRRPHFLPPISQSDCLLNVPLVLPENSPPPSPSRVTSAPFFPLQVPTLPLWTEHRLKHT